MTSVKGRIYQIKQPPKGLVPISKFYCIRHKCKEELNEEENIKPNIVGLAVDYLTRFMINNDAAKSFEVSLKGAELAEKYFNEYNASLIAKELIKNVNGVDKTSILNAVNLVNYDVFYRNGLKAKDIDMANLEKPDDDTIENIRIMVERSVNCLKHYNRTVVDGFSFNPNGYTEYIDSGDGDYISEDTIWDLKVSKYPPTTNDTLQLAIYYRMWQHSDNSLPMDITRLAIYNPRLNCVYSIETKDIESNIINIIDNDIIGYDMSCQEEIEI